MSEQIKLISVDRLYPRHQTHNARAMMQAGQSVRRGRLDPGMNRAGA